MHALEQTLHVNPTREDRKPTDRPFLGVFAFIVFVWLVIVIKVLVGEPSQEVNQYDRPTFPTVKDESSKDIDVNDQTTFPPIEDETSQKFDDNYQTDSPTIDREIDYNYQTDSPKIKREIDEDDEQDYRVTQHEFPSEVDRDHPILSSVIEKMNFSITGTFLICTVISGAVALGYTYYLSLPQGKFAVQAAMGFLCIMIAFFTLLAVLMLFLLLSHIYMIVPAIFILIFAAYLVTNYLCARGAGADAIFEIIRDSARALIRSPTILLFALAMTIVIVLIMIFSVHISDRILSSKNGVYIYMSLNAFGAKAVINFFTNFIHMVVSEYAVDWFWTKNQPSSSFSIRRNLGKTFSYHLGTVAYASIPILSHMASIFQVFKCRDSDKDVIKIYNIYTRFFSQLGVTLYVTDFALIQTSIYGYDYGTAIMAAHDIVAQNNHEFSLAVTEVANAVTSIGSFFITLPFSYHGIQSSVYSPLILFALVFTTVVRTLLVNKMIMKYTSDALQEECEITPKAVSPQTPVDV